MKFITSSLAIFIEFTTIILASLWYSTTKEIEPLITLCTSIGLILLGVISRFTARPRIVLHHNKAYYGRSPMGYTPNNLSIIIVNDNTSELFWKLNWNFDLEFRNNSSIPAYNIEFNYINQPRNTSIEGNVGKIEPILSHELRNFKFQFVQYVKGSYNDVEKYMNENITKLTEQFIIEIKYSDESGFKYKTQYRWRKDENTFPFYYNIPFFRSCLNSQKNTLD